MILPTLIPTTYGTLVPGQRFINVGDPVHGVAGDNNEFMAMALVSLSAGNGLAFTGLPDNQTGVAVRCKDGVWGGFPYGFPVLAFPVDA